jgi:hypothetical protein
MISSAFSYCDAVQNAISHQSRRDIDSNGRCKRKRKSWILPQLPCFVMDSIVLNWGLLSMVKALSFKNELASLEGGVCVSF